MNENGNMTPLSIHHYQAPFADDGGQRTGVSPAPVSPYSQVPPLTRYPAGSPHFSPGPRMTTPQSLPGIFSYLPQTCLSSTSFHNSLSLPYPSSLSFPRASFPLKYPSPSSSLRASKPPVYLYPSSSRPAPLPPACPATSSFRRGSVPHFNPGPRSVSPPAPVFSSLPPSPVFSSLAPEPVFPSLPPSPVFSSLPPAPVYSSKPPAAPSPSSVRRNSRPPKYPSPSAQVEKRDHSSIGFNQNPSPLPPQAPVKRSNSKSVSGNNTQPPRKSRKRTNSDIIGINSTIPLNPPPESTYLSPSNPLVGNSSCYEEGAIEWTYDKNARDEFYNEFMILDNTNNDANGKNVIVDDVMMTIPNSDGQNNANENMSKTGPTTSGVKRRAGKDICIDPSSSHNKSVSMDNSFNKKLKPSPSLVDGTEDAFNFMLGKGVYTSYELEQIACSAKLRQIAVDPKKCKRILSNRASAARSKERKEQNIVALQHRLDTLQHEYTSMSRKITVLEKDKLMIMNETNEMKIKVESLEQQGKLRDEIKRLKAETALTRQQSGDAQRLKEALALTEQLRAEIERLKVKQNHSQFDGSNMQPNLSK